MEPSELTHEYLDSRNESSVAYQFARYGQELDYNSLPDQVVHQLKRSLLDSLGCAIGAQIAPGRDSCEKLIRELGGPQEATVIGSGFQTSAPNAALINSFLVRYLDYNESGGGGHNSDAIPSLIAVAEKENASGKELLSSMAISYELGARVRKSGGGLGGWSKRGWTYDVRGGLSMPPALGKLMGLTESQVANAIGCCASRNLPLGILDAHREELSMTKNIRFGSVAYDATLSCILAKHGFTGPVRIVEGEGGINEVLFDGEMDFDSLFDFSSWFTTETSHKTLCANSTSHGHILATISIVEENDLDPEDIESVLIKAGSREIVHTFNQVKKYPRNGETANHSGYYANAFAIKERGFGPESHNPTHFKDPVILDLMEKITAEPDPDISEYSRSGISIITTTDGEKFQARKSPPGYGGSDLPDEQLEDKFRAMATDHLAPEEIQLIFDTIWDLETVTDLNTLTEPLTLQ